VEQMVPDSAPETCHRRSPITACLGMGSGDAADVAETVRIDLACSSANETMGSCGMT
jgi:hypothetical protein